jgi:hypothetical protein
LWQIWALNDNSEECYLVDFRIILRRMLQQCLHDLHVKQGDQNALHHEKFIWENLLLPYHLFFMRRRGPMKPLQKLYSYLRNSDVLSCDHGPKHGQPYWKPIWQQFESILFVHRHLRYDHTRKTGLNECNEESNAVHVTFMQLKIRHKKFLIAWKKESHIKIKIKKINWDGLWKRSQWPHGLRHEPSSPARTLGLWIRIPLEAWMSVCIYSPFVLFRV